ncbi:LysR family transcriptional regulator [Marinovum sp.]|uniref:LysR family transcriptional regulator n=1 Tax=Marinovum sp. TaxID=2024839 RepID=UPI002B26C62F|nr:LysR family transcriptional regulator [Marinovum sp.]
MHNDNWDDLKFVLCVADTGSVSGAARVLGVNHATVLRRVAAFEEAHGTPVFERSQQGYRLRTDRADVIEAAREAAQALGRVSHLLRGDAAVAGDFLRLTSTDSFCAGVLAAGMGRISEVMAPHRVCLMSSNVHLDMGRLQADVTVRPARSKPADMAGTAAAELGFATYARDAEETRWLGLAGPLARAAPAQWMAEHVPSGQITACADSFLVLREMALQGQGIAILPQILAAACPGLQRVARGLPEMRIPVWVLCHRDLAGSPRMARFMAVVSEVLQVHGAELAGG